MHACDPHHAEYLAAAAALHEQTPVPEARHEPALGDFISGVTAGRYWSGKVEWVNEGQACINVGGGWVYVPLADITH